MECFAFDGIVPGRVAFVVTADPVEALAKDQHLGAPEAFAIVDCQLRFMYVIGNIGLPVRR